MRDMTLEISQLTMPYQANPAGIVHGGEVMKLMDTAAGSLAIRYAKGNCVTARMDELEFRRSVYVGDLITCTARLDYVGNSSMEIFVSVEAETLTGSEGKKQALSAYFTMVALGEDGKPRTIPQFTPETPDEIERYAAAKKRRQGRRRG